MKELGVQPDRTLLADLLAAVTTPNNSDRDSERRIMRLISLQAELNYRQDGGGRCSECRTPVRHLVRVVARKTDGSSREFQCLCTRCLEAERATSVSLMLSLGDMRIEMPNRSGTVESFAPVTMAKRSGAY
jgi:hypothetical protein